MDGLHRLHVLIGSIRMPNAQSQPTLVVEAQADRLEALRQQLGPMLESGDLELRQAVLSVTTNLETVWYRFNDARLNGVLPLESWQPFYPNLQLLGHDIVAAETLAEILNDWPAANQGQQGIELTIAQGDPIHILKGAGAWLHRLQKILLVGPRSHELWQECCNSWLLQHGFQADPQTPGCWNLDRVALLLIQHQAEVEALNQMHQQELCSYAEDRKTILDALRHVFPYANYRRLRSDIASLSDEELVDHFIEYGIHEGVNLQFSDVEKQLQRLRNEQTTQAARLELLTEKNRHTSQQLDLLKDLFSRLLVKS